MMLVSVLSVPMLSLLCAGCGAVVPEVGEIWDNNSGIPADKTLEMLIKKKVFCELQRAVSDIQAEPGFTVIFNNGKTIHRMPLIVAQRRAAPVSTLPIASRARFRFLHRLS